MNGRSLARQNTNDSKLFLEKKGKMLQPKVISSRILLELDSCNKNTEKHLQMCSRYEFSRDLHSGE